MPGSDSRKELALKMDQHELDAIAQAARLDGMELKAWARQALLNAAKSQIAGARRKATPTQFDPTNPAIGLNAEPRICWCGNTTDPRGECDGSCLNSY